MDSYQLLERKWAEFNEVDPKGMVACSTGTSALELAFKSLGAIGAFDYNLPISFPSIMMISGLRAIVNSDLEVFIEDVDNNAHVVYRKPIGGGITSSGVLAAHLYGRRVQDETCDSTIKVEDLAQAHGIKPTGEAACWSFYRNKVVHGEEGGAVWFEDPEAAEVARCLRDCGHLGEYVYRWGGSNFRLSNVHADLILGSIEQYSNNMEARRLVQHWYDEYLPDEMQLPEREIPWVYDFKLPTGINSVHFFRFARKQLEGLRLYFPPTQFQLEIDHPTRSVNAERIWSERVYLPIYPSMTKGYIKDLVANLLRLIEKFEQLPSDYFEELPQQETDVEE